MKLNRNPWTLCSILLLSLSLLAAGCELVDDDDDGDDGPIAPGLVGPGLEATDLRSPELGADLRVLQKARVGMADVLSGREIEAKFELDDDGDLSLSVYPAARGLSMDAERNELQELAGDPTVVPFAGATSTFEDEEHLLRAARDLTLVQLSRKSLKEAIASFAGSTVYWAVPTIRGQRAGYGVYMLEGRHDEYTFVDGDGARVTGTAALEDLGSTPGSGATDARVPELGEDLSVLEASKISMADALRRAEESSGPVIEAKFELDDSGKLSLSVYPIGKGLDVDAERNAFRELAGDPTADTWAPSLSEFHVPDAEHLTRSARELTIIQTAALSLREAVDRVSAAIPNGRVFWAIPTIRDSMPGYGVYTRGADGAVHYFFVR